MTRSPIVRCPAEAERATFANAAGADIVLSLHVDANHSMHAEGLATPAEKASALPVTGDCELIVAEMTGSGDADASHVAGWISHNGEVIEVLNLDALTPGETALSAGATPGVLLEARL